MLKNLKCLHLYRNLKLPGTSERISVHVFRVSTTEKTGVQLQETGGDYQSLQTNTRQDNSQSQIYILMNHEWSEH